MLPRMSDSFVFFYGYVWNFFLPCNSQPASFHVHLSSSNSLFDYFDDCPCFRCMYDCWNDTLFEYLPRASLETFRLSYNFGVGV